MNMQTAPPALDPATELVEIARAVSRLVPSWQRPELFHEQKSEISARLRRLAGLANGQPWPPVSRPTPPPRIVPTVEVRVVTVALPRRLLRPPRHHYPKPPRLSAEMQATLNL